MQRERKGEEARLRSLVRSSASRCSRKEQRREREPSKAGKKSQKRKGPMALAEVLYCGKGAGEREAGGLKELEGSFIGREGGWIP